MDENTVGVIKPGISFGELGVLYGSERTASCVSLTDVYCIGIDAIIFQHILGDQVRNLNNKRL
jgi:CRP-like cAMP-binding protein